VYPTPSGRARFVATEYVAPAEEPDAEFPLRLNTGRLRDQWHSMTRTGLVGRLLSHSPDPEIALNPCDLAANDLISGDLVRVASRRGAVVIKARAVEEMRRGDAFLAMHWGSRHVAGAGTNALTLPAFDPSSKQPELKHAAVRIERFIPEWRSIALCAVSTAGEATRLRREIAPLMQRFDYGALGLAEGERLVVSVELASAMAPAADSVADLDRLFGLSREDGIAIYSDVARRVEKRARFDGGALAALRLTGDMAGAARLRQAMLERIDVTALGIRLLAPLAGLAGLPQGRGRTVCSCLNVGERDISAAIADGATLPQLQAALKCGTECGSCVPELRRLVANAAPAPAAGTSAMEAA
jgi:assimilatory nitrate reductase catalytic subunit